MNIFYTLTVPFESAFENSKVDEHILFLGLNHTETFFSKTKNGANDVKSGRRVDREEGRRKSKSGEVDVDGAESAGASDASAAVDDDGAGMRLEIDALIDERQESAKSVSVFGKAMVRPLAVLEMIDLARGAGRMVE